MVDYITNKKGYFYKVYNNGKKVRISKYEYIQKKSTISKKT